MQNFKKKIIQLLSSTAILIAIMLFLNHLACTLLYLAPENPATNYYQSYVYRYIDPFFLQRWQLFAPEPQTVSVKLWYRCESAGNWTGWKDPTFDLIEKHQNFRLGYYGKELYVFKGITRNLANIVYDRNSPKKLAQMFDYQNAKHLVSDLCQKEIVNTKTIQFSLVTLNPKNYSKRKEPGYFGKYTKFDFPPDEI